MPTSLPSHSPASTRWKGDPCGLPPLARPEPPAGWGAAAGLAEGVGAAGRAAGTAASSSLLLLSSSDELSARALYAAAGLAAAGFLAGGGVSESLESSESLLRGARTAAHAAAGLAAAAALAGGTSSESLSSSLLVPSSVEDGGGGAFEATFTGLAAGLAAAGGGALRAGGSSSSSSSLLVSSVDVDAAGGAAFLGATAAAAAPAGLLAGGGAASSLLLSSLSLSSELSRRSSRCQVLPPESQHLAAAKPLPAHSPDAPVGLHGFALLAQAVGVTPGRGFQAARSGVAASAVAQRCRNAAEAAVPDPGYTHPPCCWAWAL